MNGLILLPDVFDDVANAAQWYDEEGGQGLGDRFLACFYAYLPQIESQGEIHRKVYKDFRRVLLRACFENMLGRSCGGAGRLASLLLGQRSTRDMRLRRASPSAPPRSQSRLPSYFQNTL